MSKDKIQKADKQDLSLVVRAIGSDLEHTNSFCKRRHAFPLLESGAFHPLPPKERSLGKQSY